MTQQTEPLRPKYKRTRLKLNKQKMASLKESIYQRKIRTGTVKAIYEQLLAGVHFESALCINRVVLADGSTEDRIFDGGHRRRALVKYFNDLPTAEIEVEFNIYDNLSEDEEREEYTLINKGNKQNTNDFVQAYKDEIPAYQTMQNGWNSGQYRRTFPCKVKVYSQAGAVHFFRLVGGYMEARSDSWGGQYTGSPSEFVEDAKALTTTDVEIMANFMVLFQGAFGPLKGNPWLGVSSFPALMKIYMDNVTTIPHEKMESLFKQKLAKDYTMAQLAKASGLSGAINGRIAFVNALNAGRRVHLFH